MSKAQHHLLIEGKDKGPYTLEQVQTLWELRVITGDTLHWMAGYQDWLPLELIRALMEAIEPENPFVASAGINTLGAEDYEECLEQRRDDLFTVNNECEAVLRTKVLPRVALAAEAVRLWGLESETTGPFRTESITGVSHIRVKLVIRNDGYNSSLEFIGSPHSQIIGVEGNTRGQRQNWQPISLTDRSIPNKVDYAIHQFLTWTS